MTLPTRKYPAKKFTVKEWGKFEWFQQEILCRKYKIILTDHQTKSEKLHQLYKKIIHIDIDRTLTKVTKNIDDFSKMTDSMKGIGGKQKDLSGLLSTQKKGKLSL